MSIEETDSRLTELALELKGIAASPEHARRRKLWADVVNLRTTRAVVNSYLYEDVWAAELAGASVRSGEGFAREIETQLAFKVWRAKNFHDDCPAEPAIRVVASRPAPAAPAWGMEMSVTSTDAAGAYKEVPSIREYKDIEMLRSPGYRIDRAETARIVETAQALTGGVLPVVVRTDEMHWGPFEYAVRLRGIENLLFDVYDAPEFVHRLMGAITGGLVSYEKEREAAGDVSTAVSGFGHVPYDEAPESLRNRLKGMWAYIHAQSAASLSPDMYAEFVHPYNCRLAELVGRVYYHGCEDLSRKCRAIKTLPNLRLFHISPWTPAQPVISEMGGGFAYEMHSHPTNVVFGESRAEIKSELRRMEAAARGTSHVLTLADIETFAGRFERVAYWADAAQEAAAG